jgi:hypothetical protein
MVLGAEADFERSIVMKTFLKKFTDPKTREDTIAVVKNGKESFEVMALAKHFDRAERADSFQCGLSFCLQDELKTNLALRALLKISPKVAEPRIAFERTSVFIQTGPTNWKKQLPMIQLRHNGKTAIDSFDATGKYPAEKLLRIRPAPKSGQIGRSRNRPAKDVLVRAHTRSSGESSHSKPRLRRTYAQIMLDQKRATLDKTATS